MTGKRKNGKFLNSLADPFLTPFRHPMLTGLDDRKDYGEDRWSSIGLMKNMIAVIVYLEWDGENHIRFISARRALRYERKQYENEIRY